MTNEEAIADIRDNIKPIVGGKSLDMAIEALEREPCEDCISRQEAIKAIYGYSFNIEMSSGVAQYKSQIANMLQAVHQMQKKLIEDLPPVTPQPKMGRWIFDEILDKHYYCSECKSMGVDYWDYCPNCGAKMIELQESEDKE